MFPPFEKHRIADQLEPGRELRSLVVKHPLQLAFGNISRVFDFVGIRRDVNVGLDEEYVVDLLRQN